MSDGCATFFTGFIAGVLSLLIGLLILAELDSTHYKFVDVDGLFCLEVDGIIVSCNWEDW